MTSGWVGSRSPGDAAPSHAALRARFDANGDGKLSGAELAGFKVMVTLADGTLVAKTLAELGITEIGLKGDATHLVLADGSSITGQATFVMNGQTHTLGNATFLMDAQGRRVVEAASVGGK